MKKTWLSSIILLLTVSGSVLVAPVAAVKAEEGLTVASEKNSTQTQATATNSVVASEFSQKLKDHFGEKLQKVGDYALADFIYYVAFNRDAAWFWDNMSGVTGDNTSAKAAPYGQELAYNTQWYQNTATEDWYQSFVDNDGQTKQLHASFLKSEKPSNKTVIIAHGYRMNGGKTMGAFAKMYHDMGYNILTPDARAHGQSEGNQISFGWKEKDDYANWSQQIVDRLGAEQQITLHGVSMGGATVMMTSGVALPDNVKAIVEDCGYDSVYGEFNFLKTQLVKGLNGLLTEDKLNRVLAIVDQLLQERQGFSLEGASSVNQLAQTTLPVLFIHGEQDTFVPTYMVHNVFPAAGGPKQLFTVPNAGHGMAIAYDLPGYVTNVQNFLGQYVTN